MTKATFVVAFHQGSWRINYHGQWYGAYSDRPSAEKASVAAAQANREMLTRVVVRQPDGSEELVWDPLPSCDQLPRGH
jgi:hypothetical protein